MTNSFNWTSTFGSSQDPGIERRDRETLEREKEIQRLIEAEREEEEILTDNAGRIREKDLQENPPLENLEFQGIETKPEHWLLRSLGWVGDRFDDVDRAAGIGEFNIYNARQKILKPLTETHVALGILGELFVPDTLDIATLGFSYIPKRFAKIPKVWAKLTKAMNGDAARAILRGDDMLVDSRGIAKKYGLTMTDGTYNFLPNFGPDELLSVHEDLLNTTSIKPLMSKGDNYIQGQLPIERFQTISYKDSVISKMTPFGGSMRNGVMNVKAVDSVKIGKRYDKKQRAMLEAYLSPDRLAGSFDNFGKANRPGFAAKWADFLKARGLDPIGDIQIHHINPLYDSIHLFDGVKFDSKEYWDTIEALIQGNARTGVINRSEDVNNLMMTLGKGKVVDTPHGIAHKYLDAQTPTFFSKTEMARMSNPKGFTDEAGRFWKPGEYRLQKANDWAVIVNKSEEIILEAHKQWSLLNPKLADKLSFEKFNSELVNRLMEYTDQGYSKLLDPNFQLSDFSNIIQEILSTPRKRGPKTNYLKKIEKLGKKQGIHFDSKTGTGSIQGDLFDQ